MMKCEKVINNYDQFRDHDLNPATEMLVIQHLESCATCSMEYDIRDEALGALQNFSNSVPPLSDISQEKIRLLSIKKSPSFYKGLSSVLAVACVLLLVFRPQTKAPENQTLQNEISNLKQQKSQVVQDLSNSKKNNRHLIHQLAKLSEIEDNQTAIKKQLNKIDLTGSEVMKIVESIGNDLKKAKLVFQENGGQAAIMTGIGWEDEKKNEFISNHPKENIPDFKQRFEVLANTLVGDN